MKKINIAILGYGVIGKGVFEICKNMPNINVVKILERKEKIKQLTIDHSYVEKLINDGTITREESKNHPQKNMLTKALRMYCICRTRFTS